MKSGVLKRAHVLFQKKRYAQVISLLEPQVFLFRENPRFYYMLGVSCLYTDDTGGAFSYLKRANQLDLDDPRIMHALAAVHLKRRETDESLRLWLAILDRDPKNRIARRGLDLIKRNIEPGMLVEAIEAGQVRALYPKPPFRFPRSALVVAVLLFILIPAAFLATPAIVKQVNASTPQRNGVAVLKIGPDVKDLTAFSGTFRYILTPAEIKDTFGLIQKDFNEYRDNLARMETNRILQSNASAELKEKANLIRSYLAKPSFVDFRDNFTYTQVTSDPYLYGGCYVRWSGKISNLNITNKAITFDFLVGYENEKVLSGVVPVTMGFAADLHDAEAVEIIAKVENNNGNISLEATSIRPLPSSGGN